MILMLVIAVLWIAAAAVMVTDKKSKVLAHNPLDAPSDWDRDLMVMQNLREASIEADRRGQLP
mgnify:CR=1 FL=1